MFQSNTRFFFKSHLQGKLFFCPSQPLLQEILGLGGKPLTVRYYWEWGEKSMNPIQNWREEPWDWFSVYLLRGQCKSSEITSERPSPDKLSPACYSAGETWAQSGKEAAQILQQQFCTSGQEKAVPLHVSWGKESWKVDNQRLMWIFWGNDR